MRVTFADLVKLLLLAFALVIALRFLQLIAHVVLLFALIIILCMVLTAPVSWLERRGVVRGYGTALVGSVLVILALLAGRVLLLPLLEQFTQFVMNVPTLWGQAQYWLGGLTGQFPALRGLIAMNEQFVNGLLARVGDLLLFTGQFLMGTMTNLALAAIAGVTALYTTAMPRSLLTGLFAMLPEPARLPVARALRTTTVQMRVWLGASILVGIIDGSIIWLGLSLLGVQPALVLAVLVFFGEFIPYVGPIVAAIPAVLLALLVSPGTALWTLLLYLAVQQVEGNLLAPFILARGMKFHPLSVTFAIIALGEVYGILGAFLAIPAVAAVKAFYEELVLAPRHVNEAALRDYADLVLQAHPVEAGARPPGDDAAS